MWPRLFEKNHFQVKAIIRGYILHHEKERIQLANILYLFAFTLYLVLRVEI
jgi:hypothetical protein